MSPKRAFVLYISCWIKQVPFLPKFETDRPYSVFRSERISQPLFRKFMSPSPPGSSFSAVRAGFPTLFHGSVQRIRHTGPSLSKLWNLKNKVAESKLGHEFEKVFYRLAKWAWISRGPCMEILRHSGSPIYCPISVKIISALFPSVALRCPLRICRHFVLYQYSTTRILHPEIGPGQANQKGTEMYAKIRYWR